VVQHTQHIAGTICGTAYTAYSRYCLWYVQHIAGTICSTAGDDILSFSQLVISHVNYKPISWLGKFPSPSLNWFTGYSSGCITVWKVRSSLLPWRAVVERLCIMSYKMTCAWACTTPSTSTQTEDCWLSTYGNIYMWPTCLLMLQMVLGWRPHVLEHQHVLCVSVKELLLL